MSGQFLSWFKNYLSVVNYQELPSTMTRVQRVVFDGAASQWAPVTSGVQQGSLLGPLLFTIFFNDLPNASEGIVTTALYVDDTKNIELHRFGRRFQDITDHSFKDGTLE